MATALFYLLQIIDANVFAYMHDFEVSDSISMKLEPAVLPADNYYASGTPAAAFGMNSIGLRLGLRF